MKTNRAMATLLASSAAPGEITVPYSFRALLDNGFEELDACVFFRELLPADAGRRIREEDFGAFDDRTGYECFVNKIHVEDYLESEAADILVLARTSIACAAHLAERLRMVSSDSIRIIVSTDDEVVVSSTLRFHKLRRDETWLMQDLDAYEQPICVIDTPNVIAGRV